MPFPVDEQYILACELALGASLPDGYRCALMARNGGEIRADGDLWTLHPVCDRSDRKRLGRTSNHILSETYAQAAWPGWPDGALFIAANGSGDSLILRRRVGGLLRRRMAFDAAIWVWDHETGHTRKIADDFTALG